MPKQKIDQAQAVREVKAAWHWRGFREDYLAAHQYERDGDGGGELAYQRAFAEAAKKDPPRLPNPSHYPNSVSAQAFIQKQNAQFFNSSAGDVPNPKYESPIPDMYWKAKDQDSAYRSASSTPSVTNGRPPTQTSTTTTTTTATTTSPTQNGYMPATGISYVTSPTTGSRPPLPMEPRMGAPAGPPSRLR